MKMQMKQLENMFQNVKTEKKVKNVTDIFPGEIFFLLNYSKPTENNVRQKHYVQNESLILSLIFTIKKSM